MEDKVIIMEITKETNALFDEWYLRACNGEFQNETEEQLYVRFRNELELHLNQFVGRKLSEKDKQNGIDS